MVMWLTKGQVVRLLKESGYPTLWLEDNEKLYFGDDKDTSLYFDGTDFWINYSGYTKVSGYLWATTFMLDENNWISVGPQEESGIWYSAGPPKAVTVALGSDWQFFVDGLNAITSSQQKAMYVKGGSAGDLPTTLWSEMISKGLGSGAYGNAAVFTYQGNSTDSSTAWLVGAWIGNYEPYGIGKANRTPAGIASVIGIAEHDGTGDCYGLNYFALHHGVSTGSAGQICNALYAATAADSYAIGKLYGAWIQMVPEADFDTAYGIYLDMSTFGGTARTMDAAIKIATPYSGYDYGIDMNGATISYDFRFSQGSYFQDTGDGLEFHGTKFKSYSNTYVYGNLSVSQVFHAPSQPSCRAYQSTAQSIPDSTWTSITFDSENFDTQSMHDTATNPERITIPTGGDGTYLITTQTVFAANATGYRSIRILLNGTTVLAVGAVTNPSGSYTTSVHITTIEQLSAGDYIEVQAYQDSGGALNTAASRQDTFIAVSKIA